MKTVGIIVEYNPLHNGHLHHIEETRRLSKCDCLIAVMSGNFTQRGEPAMIDKFTRTKMALMNKVDLVIELPFVFSVQSADMFSLTSVAILDKLGVDEIYFGSESGDIEQLESFVDVLETDEYNRLVKQFMSEGNSYPTSSDKAVQKLSKNDVYDMPNNILGIQYIKAIRTLQSSIKMKTIKRIQTDYFDDVKEGTTIQSATAIRKQIAKKEDISNYVPRTVNDLLTSRKIIDFNLFSEQLRYLLSSSTKEDLKAIFNINEGLENRILKIKQFVDTDDLIHQLLTRRYTNSKIKRSLIHILCNTKKELIESFEIPYIRVLGMNESGKQYLHSIKKELEIPLVTKATEDIHPYLTQEIKASKIYSLVSDKDIFKEEFQPVIIIK